ncbi:MAG: C40 family peptidase [Clostridiales bacterium]|jgi:cell wall-associated NlpC family hydrolase|nr:C40 family peptidase [Clostridiales bacterium]
MAEKILGLIIIIILTIFVLNNVIFKNGNKLSQKESQEAYQLIENETDPDLKSLMEAASSLVGYTKYEWGGKSPAGGLPESLDCSGYTDWVYKTGADFTGLSAGGTAHQFFVGDAVNENELRIGDLGFWKNPDEVDNTPSNANHVGIYIGKLENGKQVFIHCSSKEGVNISEFPFKYFRRVYK